MCSQAAASKAQEFVEIKSYFVHYVRNADSGVVMKTMSARDAKNGFGHLLDTARAEPVMIEKHGRPVVVVVASEVYERLVASAGKARRLPAATQAGARKRR